MEGPAPLSTQLAERLANFRLKDVPSEVVSHAKLILLDTIGAILAASNPKYSATRILVDFAKQLGGRPESSLVGQRFKTSCVNAALVNGTLGYYCDVEPHHVGGILHAPAVMVTVEKIREAGAEAKLEWDAHDAAADEAERLAAEQAAEAERVEQAEQAEQEAALAAAAAAEAAREAGASDAAAVEPGEDAGKSVEEGGTDGER